MLLSYISKELSLLCFSAVYAYIILIRLVLTLVSGLYSLNIQRKELLFLHCHHFWVLTLDWSLPILTSKLDYFHFIPDLPCTAPLGILFISFLCIKIFRPLARDLVFCWVFNYRMFSRLISAVLQILCTYIFTCIKKVNAFISGYQKFFHARLSAHKCAVVPSLKKGLCV